MNGKLCEPSTYWKSLHVGFAFAVISSHDQCPLNQSSNLVFISKCLLVRLINYRTNSTLHTEKQENKLPDALAIYNF